MGWRLKALSLWQPWASYVALGMKQFETRSWRTDYRGPLAIHAAKRALDPDGRFLLSERPFPYGAGEMPFGAIIATCELVECVRMQKALIDGCDSRELDLGCWEVGRYAWCLINVVRIEPVFVKGAQRLWDWDR